MKFGGPKHEMMIARLAEETRWAGRCLASITCAAHIVAHFVSFAGVLDVDIFQLHGRYNASNAAKLIIKGSVAEDRWHHYELL